ncbi:hypothetical protein ACTXGL_01090 [Psychrobacter sp. T6-6]|uniref:hypothetical protein n=1 Tax=Psychrobacter sp. T6-6 TaxID=3457452 RepID=UPI003FD42E8A
MFKAVMKTIPDKQTISTALSAILLLTVASPALANSDIVNTSAQITNTTNITNCRDDLQSHVQKQAHSYKYQSQQQRVLNCMVAQLEPYQQKDKTAHEQYLAYKAQAWLTYAINKDSMNSRSSAGSVAVEMAETILQALKNNSAQDMSIYQDIPTTSALMRPDLWATLSALKDGNGIASAPREMAFGEVALIWAATNQCERGWRESGIHFRMADRWLEQAREAYINAHDSQTNVALETSIISYYQQYAPLDAVDDVCRGQDLTPNS